MARVRPFESHTRRYDRWFARHQEAYLSELRALEDLVPAAGTGLEIGVGTGRFAGPLGIAVGIDPSPQMLRYARRRGIAAVGAIAEALPFRDAAFDHVLIVTTICFVDDAPAMLREARRVLRPGGVIVIGFIDRTSRLGRHYQAHRSDNVFYREAEFFSAGEVDRMLAEAGFGRRTWLQTLSGTLAGMTEMEPPRPGFGDGAFVAVRAARPRS